MKMKIPKFFFNLLKKKEEKVEIEHLKPHECECKCCVSDIEERFVEVAEEKKPKPKKPTDKKLNVKKDTPKTNKKPLE